MQATDTTAIERLIRRARARIRGQAAIEGATTASIAAAAGALVTIFLMRVTAISGSTGVALLIACGAAVIAGALAGAARKLDDESVARQIDRASGLSDRLSTAIAFARVMASSRTTVHDETTDLMVAAIKDGVRASPRADVAKATPFKPPRDLRAAAGFLAVSALAAGIGIPQADRSPRLFRADPDVGRPGDVVLLRGANLLTGLPTPVAIRRDAARALGASGAELGVEVGYVPTDGRVMLGTSSRAIAVELLDWSRSTIRVRIPEAAPLGPTHLTAYIRDRAVGQVPFEVVSLEDQRYHKENAVALDPDDRAYLDSILNQLKAVAKRDDVPELEEFAAKIEQMIKDAEQGKITKEQLLDALKKAEDAMNQHSEPDEAEINKQLADLGKELSKEQLTKELGQALEQHDLQKAKEELEKLADRLDPEQMKQAIENLKKELENKDLTEQQRQELQQKLEQLQKDKPLDPKQKEKLQDKLEQVAKQMEQKQNEQKQTQTQQQQKLENEIKRLEKKQQEAKTEQEKLEAERQLQKKKDELQKLQKNQDAKDQSAQREALKRLHKDLQKAAENLDQPKKDPTKSDQEQDEEQKERERQASRNLKDAARETGRVDKDQRKQSAQKKMSSQMDDLREAMRRAKQKGNKGPQDPFNKQGKNKDFAQRAKGQKGSGGQSWKPGQPGQGQPGGQGNQPGGQNWGTGHDDNLAGDPTQKSGNTKDEDLTGTQGGKGTSRRETILAAAQKGFSSVSYKEVYAEYQRIVEEVMRTEKLPASYKYYVKRYFAKIHPSTAQETP